MFCPRSLPPRLRVSLTHFYNSGPLTTFLTAFARIVFLLGLSGKVLLRKNVLHAHAQLRQRRQARAHTHTNTHSGWSAQRSGITHTERELYNLLQSRTLQSLDDEPFRDGFVGGRGPPPLRFLFDRAVCTVCVRYACGEAMPLAAGATRAAMQAVPRQRARCRRICRWRATRW